MEYDIIEYLDYQANEIFIKVKHEFHDFVNKSKGGKNCIASYYVNEFNKLKEDVEIDGFIFYNQLIVIEDNDELYFELNRIEVEDVLKSYYAISDHIIKIENLDQKFDHENLQWINGVIGILSNEMYYKYIQTKLKTFELNKLQTEALELGLFKTFNTGKVGEGFVERKYTQSYALLHQLGIIEMLESKFSEINSKKMGSLLANICNADDSAPSFCRLYRATKNSFDKNNPLTHKNIEFANEIINKNNS